MIEAVLAGAVAGLASLPHCAAMCGSIAASACATRRTGGAYLGARLVAYASLGALAGTIGHAAASVLPTRAATVVLSVVFAGTLFALGVRSLATSSEPRLVTLRRSRASTRSKTHDLLVALGLGLGTGLLPCAALYSTLLLAASAGSARNGAMLLASFALVSAPGLLFAQVLARWLVTRGAAEGRRIVGGVLVLGALLVLLRAVSVLVAVAPACHAA